MELLRYNGTLADHVNTYLLKNGYYKKLPVTIYYYGQSWEFQFNFYDGENGCESLLIRDGSYKYSHKDYQGMHIEEYTDDSIDDLLYGFRKRLDHCNLECGEFYPTWLHDIGFFNKLNDCSNKLRCTIITMNNSGNAGLLKISDDDNHDLLIFDYSLRDIRLTINGDSIQFHTKDYCHDECFMLYNRHFMQLYYGIMRNGENYIEELRKQYISNIYSRNTKQMIESISSF